MSENNGSLPYEMPKLFDGIFPWRSKSPEVEYLTEARLRQIMTAALDRVIADLFPDSQDKGFINPQHFATVEFETDEGEKWGGVIYPREPVK